MLSDEEIAKIAKDFTKLIFKDDVGGVDFEATIALALKTIRRDGLNAAQGHIDAAYDILSKSIKDKSDLQVKKANLKGLFEKIGSMVERQKRESDETLSPDQFHQGRPQAMRFENDNSDPSTDSVKKQERGRHGMRFDRADKKWDNLQVKAQISPKVVGRLDELAKAIEKKEGKAIQEIAEKIRKKSHGGYSWQKIASEVAKIIKYDEILAKGVEASPRREAKKPGKLTVPEVEKIVKTPITNLKAVDMKPIETKFALKGSLDGGKKSITDALKEIVKDVVNRKSNGKKSRERCEEVAKAGGKPSKGKEIWLEVFAMSERYER